MTRNPVLIAAGGTGGHLFPAEALAHALKAREVPVVLVTDHRGERYRETFPAQAVHLIKADTIRGRSPGALARTSASLGQGLVESFAILRRDKPVAAVGFGGYPTLPPLAAAALRGLPIVVHEQNAVFGRANKVLARAATKVAIGFPGIAVPEGKGVFVGNPVRPAVIEAAKQPYPKRRPEESFRLLAFGGSQGARIMADVVPDALVRLSPDLRSRVALTLQTREEDVDRVRAALSPLGLHAIEIAPFFADLPARMATNHLIVARSGASTVAELAVIGRPSLLVPLPHAIDNDQLANARALDDAGAAMLLPQDRFTPEALAGRIEEGITDSATLERQAAAARDLGRPDAAERLADLVLSLVRSD